MKKSLLTGGIVLIGLITYVVLNAGPTDSVVFPEREIQQIKRENRVGEVYVLISRNPVECCNRISINIHNGTAVVELKQLGRVVRKKLTSEQLDGFLDFIKQARIDYLPNNPDTQPVLDGTERFYIHLQPDKEVRVYMGYHVYGTIYESTLKKFTSLVIDWSGPLL